MRSVDRFHAKQKLSDVAKSIYGIASDLCKEWGRQRHDELDVGADARHNSKNQRNSRLYSISSQAGTFAAHRVEGDEQRCPVID